MYAVKLTRASPVRCICFTPRTQTLRIVESRALEDALEAEADALRVLSLRTSAFLNLAATDVALGALQDAVRWCDKALALDEGNAKALFRRSQAFAALGEFGEARADLTRVVAADPSAQADVTAALARIKLQEAQGKAQMKKLFAGKL